MKSLDDEVLSNKVKKQLTIKDETMWWDNKSRWTSFEGSRDKRSAQPRRVGVNLRSTGEVTDEVCSHNNSLQWPAS